MVLLRSRSSCLLWSTICVAQMQSAIFILNAIYSASSTVWFPLSESHAMKQNRNRNTQVLTSNFFPRSAVCTLLIQLCSGLLSTFSAHSNPVCSVQGLKLNFHYNFYEAFYISPSYSLKLCCFLYFISVIWIQHCLVPKYHIGLFPETQFCYSVTKRPLSNCFVCLF